MHYKDKTILFIIPFLFVGCSTKITGLYPEYPPIEKGTFSLFVDHVEVDSLQPTMRWKSYPGEKEEYSLY